MARGDVTTIKQHLATLPAEYLPSYCSLGLLTTQLALQNGTISTAQAKELRELLTNQGID